MEFSILPVSANTCKLKSCKVNFLPRKLSDVSMLHILYFCFFILEDLVKLC